MVSHQSLPSSPNPEGLEPNRAEWLIPSIEMRKVLFFDTYNYPPVLPISLVRINSLAWLALFRTEEAVKD
ncbi:hypothetical protein VNO80_33100 [Phaseolus coccineus]|uniref:Uncharacterized protein n=1 Tax=Phaseolus coccineus TaxID=3886 RepID=A0AAN9KZP6_PHACN